MTAEPIRTCPSPRTGSVRAARAAARRTKAVATPSSVIATRGRCRGTPAASSDTLTIPDSAVAPIPGIGRCTAVATGIPSSFVTSLKTAAAANTAGTLARAAARARSASGWRPSSRNRTSTASARGRAAAIVSISRAIVAREMGKPPSRRTMSSSMATIAISSGGARRPASRMRRSVMAASTWSRGVARPAMCRWASQPLQPKAVTNARRTKRRVTRRRFEIGSRPCIRPAAFTARSVPANL